MDRSIRSPNSIGPSRIRTDPVGDKWVANSHPISNSVGGQVERSSLRALPVLLLAFALSGVAQLFYSSETREDSALVLAGALILVVLAALCFAALWGKGQFEIRDTSEREAQARPVNSRQPPKLVLCDPPERGACLLSSI